MPSLKSWLRQVLSAASLTIQVSAASPASPALGLRGLLFCFSAVFLRPKPALSVIVLLFAFFFNRVFRVNLS
jgi:hypothetical protein